MGFKNVKEAYSIAHSVHVRDGKICIGSAYVPDLISITMDGVTEWGKLGPSNNDELARYWQDMNADPKKLRRLINEPDTFTKSIKVYTYDGGKIIEKRCEKAGWPNVTHDGEMMYDNTFSTIKSKVVAWAKRNADCCIETFTRRIEEVKKELSEFEKLVSDTKAERANLEANYPEPKSATNPDAA